MAPGTDLWRSLTFRIWLTMSGEVKTVDDGIQECVIKSDRDTRKTNLRIVTVQSSIFVYRSILSSHHAVNSST